MAGCAAEGTAWARSTGVTGPEWCKRPSGELDTYAGPKIQSITCAGIAWSIIDCIFGPAERSTFPRWSIMQCFSMQSSSRATQQACLQGRLVHERHHLQRQRRWHLSRTFTGGEPSRSLTPFQPSRDPSSGWRRHSAGAGRASQY